MSFAFLPTRCFRPPRGSDRGVVKGHPDWELHLYRTGTDFNHWPVGDQASNFWQRASTLRFLADHSQGVTTEGLVLYHVPSEVSITLTAQTFDFRLDTQVSQEVKGPTSRWDLRRSLLSPFRSRVLAFGQLLTSGPSQQLPESFLPAEAFADLLVATAVSLTESRGGYRAVLMKDLFPDRHPVTKELRDRGFTSLPSDPVMTFDLSAFSDWEDYLAALSSKYRIRYRRARGKTEGVRRRRLTSPEVVSGRNRIYELYRITSGGADFNVTDLTPDYFDWLADNALFHGYYDRSDRLIGFTTLIPDGLVCHAHFLGLEDAYKRSHHLYHNMLFDLLEDGFAGEFQSLNFGRTALEIKSSVGAEPEYHGTLLRLLSPPLNYLAPYFIPAVFTPESWQPRNPFRAEKGA